MADMTSDVIVASCKANGGYAAPYLNDQLFLHCHGFASIHNLERYTDVKVLWLEQNALSELSGLEGQTGALVSLFVQNNFIRSLTSLTAALHGLRVLNISYNYLTSLRGLATGCPSLETLQASHNQLTSLEVCEELWQLAGTLTSVDLSFNRIEQAREPAQQPATALAPAPAAGDDVNGDDDIRIVDAAEVGGALVPVSAAAVAAPAKPEPLVLVQFFQHLPLVSVIYLQGNGLSHRLRHYRRNMILHLPALTYLDERPVFPEERRVTEAWGRGGDTAEAAERAAIRDEKRAHLTQCVSLLTEQREAQRAVRDRLTQQFDQRRAQELEELTQRRRRDRDDRAALESAEAAARTAVESAEQDARWDAQEAAQAAHAALATTESAHRHAYEQHVAVTAAAQAAAEEVVAARRQAAAAEGGSPAAGPEADSETVSAAAATLKVLEDAASSPAGSFLVASAADVPATTAAPPRPHSSALAELLQSDDDILKEMEMEIESVLYDMSASLAAKAVAGAHVNDASVISGGDRCFSSRQATDRATLRMERNVHAAVDHVSNQLRAGQAQAQQPRRGSGMARAEVWQRFEQWETRRASQHASQ